VAFKPPRFNEKNKSWQIPIILRVKFISEEGANILNFMVKDAGIIDYEDGLISFNQAIVVIDAISVSMPPYNNFNKFCVLRERCPHNFAHQNCPRNKSAHSCINCRIMGTNEYSSVIDFKSRIKTMKFDDIFYAIGASFTHNLQNKLAPSFKDFPEICERYTEFLELSRTGMCSEDISFLLIEHMYPACIGELTKKRLVDRTSDYIYKALEN